MKAIFTSMAEYQQLNRKNEKVIIDLIRQTSFEESAKTIYDNNIEIGWASNELILG